jgi:hypothetical protein
MVYLHESRAFFSWVDLRTMMVRDKMVGDCRSTSHQSADLAAIAIYAIGVVSLFTE